MPRKQDQLSRDGGGVHSSIKDDGEQDVWWYNEANQLIAFIVDVVLADDDDGCSEDLCGS
jgi:hypothetical protein